MLLPKFLCGGPKGAKLSIELLRSGISTSSNPSSAGGYRGSIASRLSAMVRATTRLRYHFFLAGTTYQGACSVEQLFMASSKAAW